ncbi:hypothetical protein LOK49_Contig739G00001, partial [Camellia lanceoleosa]
MNCALISSVSSTSTTMIHGTCPILLKNGPYGFYVQLGEDRKGYLPKRASVSQPVVLKLAKFGFSIRHRPLSIAPVPK